MQQYADIYSLQNYSTCFGCHSTHHQEYPDDGCCCICWIFLFTLNYDARNHELKAPI